VTSRFPFRSALAGTAAATLTVSLTFFVSPFFVSAARADPKPNEPTTVAQAKTLVEQLNNESAGIDQEYAAAQEKVAASKQKLAQQQADLTQQQQKVDRMRTQVASFALATYQRRGASSTAAFIGGSDTEFFNRISTIQQVSANQVTVLQKFQAEQANLDTMRVGAAAEVAARTQAEADMADARKRSAAKLAEADRVLTHAEATAMPADQFDAMLAALDMSDEAPVLARLAQRERGYHRR